MSGEMHNPGAGNPAGNPSGNPYAPPVANVVDAHPAFGEGSFIPGGRSVPAGNGAAWLSSAWQMFKAQPGAWIGLILIFFVIYFALALIPIINFFVILIMPILWGGVMVACDRQLSEGKLNIGDLFAGFQQKTGQLMLVGVIAFGVLLLSVAVFAMVAGFGFVMAMMTGGDAVAAAPAMGSILLGGLVMLILSTLMYAAMWYAPALILFQDLGAIDAMGMSLKACMKNMMPGLIYFLIVIVLAIIATIPVLLGWLVLGPVMWIAIYTSYRDIFIEE